MNPLQRASFRRKGMYFAAILGLFTLSMFWRGTIPIPLASARSASPSAVQKTAQRVQSRTILNQALALDLRELEEGEQELEGSAFRLALVGSRGLVVAYLWSSAIEAQKRNDFHEMDGLIRQVTQLQPHFITPWIFQSWNITYNVSVEMQGSGDMYYYIASGIELLAEGERRQGNVERRLGSPDMRYQIAFYYQNKFGVSDNVEVLRCLFQLSCIPPDDRNPDELEELDSRGERVVNQKKFREFCEKYPHLVRRLRGERGTGGDDATAKKIQESLKCPRPKDIIQFLRDNREVPSRYKNKKELNTADKQFPILPPKFSETEKDASSSDIGDDFTAFNTARAWYAYSCVPLPDTWPSKDANGKPMATGAPQPGEYDAVRFRVPRQPMLIIFCQGAPRAQSYQAEMEQKEGWFDDEGWRIDDPTDTPANWWFPDDPNRPTRPLNVVVGRERKWSLDHWREAATMWTNHGERYGILVEPTRLESYQTEAARKPADSAPPEVIANWQKASNALFYYTQNRQVTNFPYFLANSLGESRLDQNGRPIAVLARKALWQAEQARRLGNKLGARGAIALYREGLELWKQALAGDKEFHHPGASEKAEEETYAYELAYLRMLVQDDATVRAKASEMGRNVSMAFGTLPFPFVGAGRFATDVRDVQDEFKWHIAEKVISPFAKIVGDGDGVTDERRGGVWVRESVKEAIRVQQGVQRKPLVAPPPQPPAEAPHTEGP